MKAGPGLVLKVSLAGVEFEGDSQKMLFHAGAGENWDDLVALAVSKNCGGIECLSGIPGTVGGTPVQNVGAYGQEVSETITRVHALEIATGKILDMSNGDCGFSYRSSIFNSTHGATSSSCLKCPTAFAATASQRLNTRI